MKITYIVIVFISLAASSIASASSSLQGSLDAMKHQNLQANLEDLSRLTEKQLEAFKKKKLLVPLPKEVAIDERLPEKYRWCRPQTRRFLIDLGKAFEKKFGRLLKVNSAVRTVEYQKELQKKNSNAASAAPGPHQSSHLTGATVDIAKKSMSSEELYWMREHLISLAEGGLIEATEEFHQAVFHVMVHRNYGPR